MAAETKLKYLSLFSGIGAFEKALDNLGIPYELVGFSEIDKFAIKSYCAIHGVSPDKNLGDITQIDTATLPTDIDLITYGFPCQDISLAGRQKGFFDSDGSVTRSGLFVEALRLIRDTRPKIAICENVKNLTGKKFAEEFKYILDSLAEAGYNNYYKVLNAKNYGVPQNRERVFIVSVRKNIDTGDFEFPKPFPLEKCLGDLLEAEADEKYYLSPVAMKRLFETDFGVNKYENCASAESGISKTLCVKHDICVQIGQMYPNSGNPQAGRIYDADGISPTMDSCNGGNRMPKTLQNAKIRKLTPKECWRLMGFSDDDFEKAEKLNSNSQLYKQAGNSIVVPVLEQIFKQIF